MLRSHLWRWITVAMLAAIAAIAVLGAPTSASAATTSVRECFAAPCDNCPLATTNANYYDGGYPRPGCIRPYPVANLQYKGWVYLDLNYCPPGAACVAMYQQSEIAWHWTGSRWTQSSVDQGWVYVYPYTGQWRWVWTQRSGWVAMQAGRFEIRPY